MRGKNPHRTHSGPLSGCYAEGLTMPQLVTKVMMDIFTDTDDVRSFYLDASSLLGQPETTLAQSGKSSIAYKNPSLWTGPTVKVPTQFLEIPGYICLPNSITMVRNKSSRPSQLARTLERPGDVGISLGWAQFIGSSFTATLASLQVPSPSQLKGPVPPRDFPTKLWEDLRIRRQLHSPGGSHELLPPDHG